MIEPWRKVRCDGPRMNPGGGGVNVARAVLELGGDPLAVVALGGHVGSLLADSLRRSGVALHRISARGATRQNFAVTERTSGKQYRFVHGGARMSFAEWTRCLEATVEAAAHAACVVASSSLPPGVPVDAFAVLASRLEPLGIPIIIDTSGPALLAAMKAPVDLVKPSVNELRAVAGRALTCNEHYEAAARALLRSGHCKTVAVSLGGEGALFVPRDDDSFVVRAPEVRAVSTTGAGDSMVAGIAMSLARGDTLIDAARLGVAAGTAAVLAQGTGLCRRDDVLSLLAHTMVS